MAFCKNCGNQLENETKFCDSCGTFVNKPDAPNETNLATTVVIPNQFTDDYLEKQKSMCESRIYSFEDELEKLKYQLQETGDKMKDLRDEIRNNLRPRLSEAKEQVAIGKHNASVNNEVLFGANKSHAKSWQKTVDNIIDEMWRTEEEIKRLESVKESTNQAIEKNRNVTAKEKEELRNIDSELRKSPVQRVEKHYQTLLNKKDTSSTADELYALAKQFGEMENYKDTEERATECRNIANKLQYDILLVSKGKATSEEDFFKLAKQFRDMKDYENSEELATECKDIAVKLKYDNLVNAKNKATREEDFLKLAKQFRDMNGYKNTKELAIECENYSQVLREKAYNEAVAELQQLNVQLRQSEEEGKASASKYGTMKISYDALSKRFKAFSNYKDAIILLEQCNKNSEDCKQKKDKKDTKHGCIFFAVIAVVVVLIVAGLFSGC